MTHSGQQKLSLRSVHRHRAGGLFLTVGLIAGSICLPLCAQAAKRTTTHAYPRSDVVMMIGGMANETSIQAAQTPSAEIISASDDASRLSVVIQPGSRSLPTNAVQQTSAEIASRVMALSPVINEAAHVADVDSALLMAVIDVESGGNPQALSPKGAAGLMQLMPGTGQRHGASNLFDPRQNVAAGARYLKALTRQFGELALVLAAYNAGEGAVQKYGGQIPPYAETMNYVPKVIARYEWYRAAMSRRGGASVQEGKGSASGRFLLVGSGNSNE
jgi:soluble lytic murein transglycosylase-like protein